MARKVIPTLIFALILALATSSLSLGAPPASSAPWESKVDPWVLETAASGETEFILFLAEQADLSDAYRLPTKLEKGTYVFETLNALAEQTQGPVLAALQAEGVEHRPYWVANMIWVRGSQAVVESMARREDIAHIYANPYVHMQEPVSRGPDAPSSAPDTIEWNISKVNAPAVWTEGYTGQGAVVGGQDTGYDWDHPALKTKYRGWQGGLGVNHDYHWHDAIHSGTSDCGVDSPEPCDDHGHGTHTMGTMVGDDGLGNQIGMAPGARWIGCRNMREGVGSPTTYSECYQWFIAPTRVDGSDPDPAMAPDVINNSWGCPPSEGCTDPNVMLTVVNNVRAAGILTAHSAGNSGSSCSSVNEPAAIYEASFTVGATTITDAIAGYSSRGPVAVDGSNRLKPNISAPGSSIRSSVPGGGYQGGWSGTSMAAPHVAGMVALLVSANPDLAGQVDFLEDVIEQTALHLTSSQTCGGVPGSTIPNNTFGWGRIDALAAFNIVMNPFSLDVTPASADACVGSDVLYTASVTPAMAELISDATLSVDGLPTGATGDFSVNPVTPPGSSVLTVGTAGASPGSYILDVQANGYFQTKQRAAQMDLVTAPDALSSLTISDLGDGQVLLEWPPVAGATAYEVWSAVDAPYFDPTGMDCATPAPYECTSVATTSHTDTATGNPSANTYYLVLVANACGLSPVGASPRAAEFDYAVMPGLT